MCKWPFFYGPAVPGAIAPVNATDDMTQPVGVRNCRLYTKPGDAVVTEFESRLEAVESASADYAEDIEELQGDVNDLAVDVEDVGGDVSSLDTRVTALENAPHEGGGNAYVIHDGVVSALSNNSMSVLYPNLPAGAKIDKIEWLCFVSGGTTPRVVEMYPYQWLDNKMVSTGEGSTLAYATWDITYTNPITGYTLLTAALDSNTLFDPTFNQTGDTVSWAHIYYHV